MKKYIVYISSVIVMCLVLFAATFFTQTNETLENKRLSDFPQLIETDAATEEKSFNYDFISDLGTYFNDHYAFKPYVVSIDALIQTKIFRTSNVSNVVLGTDGWMYYRTSSEDYMSVNTISQREAFNIAHNLSLLQKNVENKGSTFLLTVPANKGTLYGDNMPYNFRVADDESNMDVLKPWLEKENVNYLDLIDIFSSQSETLYLKRDSHWNNKGAMLAYNEIMNALGIDHETYDGNEVSENYDNVGDLNVMLFPRFSKTEVNYDYGIEQTYSITNEATSVEDSLYTTTCSGQSGSLLMFRDSFANTLIPVLSENFSTAVYSKTMPYNADAYMAENPDYVVAEKAERNIRDYAENPPLMSADEVEINSEIAENENDSTCTFEQFADNINYYKVYGKIAGELDTDSRIFITINGTAYEAFCVSDDDSDNNFVLYLSKDYMSTKFDETELTMQLIVFDGGQYTCLKTENINIEE